MDREVRNEYQVVIQAKDMAGQMGGLSGTAIVNVTLTDVNDSPPRFAYSTTSIFCKGCHYVFTHICCSKPTQKHKKIRKTEL